MGAQLVAPLLRREAFLLMATLLIVLLQGGRRPMAVQVESLVG